MIKAELVSGTKVFVLKIEHLVTLSVFTQALGNQLYTDISPETEEIVNESERHNIDTDTYEKTVDEFFNNLTFFKKLTKKKAEEILRDNLKWHGRDGNMDSGMLEASYERGLIVNKCYDLTREWIIQKYPHLKPNNE